MSQHFLLSPAARTLSLSEMMRMTDDEAQHAQARLLVPNDGEPFCPYCGCPTVYTLAEAPPRWKCGDYRRKFSLTSQTFFLKYVIARFSRFPPQTRCASNRRGACAAPR
jgi:hypothetical protein